MNQVGLLLSWAGLTLRGYGHNFLGTKKTASCSPEQIGWVNDDKETNLAVSMDSDLTLYRSGYEKSRKFQSKIAFYKSPPIAAKLDHSQPLFRTEQFNKIGSKKATSFSDAAFFALQKLTLTG
jgi:hypothetical protein